MLRLRKRKSKEMRNTKRGITPQLPDYTKKPLVTDIYFIILDRFSRNGALILYE